MRVPSKTINELISENFSSCPEIIAIDIEGVDLDVLRTFDFDKYRPIVFCVETIRYSENHVKEKITEIFEFMEQHDYFVYADTYINTLFVDRLQFLKHRPKNGLAQVRYGQLTAISLCMRRSFFDPTTNFSLSWCPDTRLGNWLK